MNPTRPSVFCSDAAPPAPPAPRTHSVHLRDLHRELLRVAQRDREPLLGRKIAEAHVAHRARHDSYDQLAIEAALAQRLPCRRLARRTREVVAALAAEAQLTVDAFD